MAITKERAYRHALCMDLTPEKLSVAWIDKDQKKISEVTHFQDFEYNREGIDKITSGEFFKYDYADYILTSGSIRNTLVPTSIFNHSKPLEIFALNYTAPHENLDYNRIPELDIVNIYELPLWIKSAFVIRFPRVKLYHPTSVLLKGVFDQPVFSPKAHLLIQDHSFYLLLTEKNKLQFFNRFDYKNLADIVYHTLFVMEQKGVDPKKLTIQLYGVAENWSYYSEFVSFFQSEVKLSDSPEKGEHFLLAKQLLCV